MHKAITTTITTLALLFSSAFVHDVLSQSSMATLVLEPATQVTAPNGSFTLTIRLNTGGQNINTVAGNLTYDPTMVTPQSIDTTGSFVTIWFENNIASSNGEVRLTGSVPSPGVIGDNLLFARVNFTANQTATTQISFKDDSAVFRDTDNVDILGDTTGSVITITDASTTPTPSGQALTGTPTEGQGTLTPTALPDAGINTPTLIFFVVGVLFLIVAIGLLV